MQFKKMMNGRALYLENDRVWVAKGMRFFATDFDGQVVSPVYKVGSLKNKLFSLITPCRLLLREGLHHLLVLPDGAILVTAKKKTYIVNPDGSIRSEFSGYVGNKPAHQGVCVTPDGTLLFGEYAVNLDHSKEIHLFRSRDAGHTFSRILTFPCGDIRHIHFVKYDPYEKCLWLGTGDADKECRLMRSFDLGDTWEIVGQGSQDWRAIGVCFAEDSLVWGTDAGSVPDQNHILYMDRRNHELKVIADVPGPCHGCASFADGRVFISTGVEGGENEHDRLARLNEISGQTVSEVLTMKKNLWPLIMQYGVMRFPGGTKNSSRVVFSALGLVHGSEVVYVEKQGDGVNK